MAKTKPFSFRVEPELKAEIDAAAKAENRSFTNMVETMLKEGVERRRKPLRELAGKANRK